MTNEMTYFLFGELSLSAWKNVAVSSPSQEPVGRSLLQTGSMSQNVCCGHAHHRHDNLGRQFQSVETVGDCWRREAGTAQWLERRTRDQKVAGSSPGRRIFFFPGPSLSDDSYFGIRSAPVLLQ